MTCKKCGYQFCWICLRGFPKHNRMVHLYRRYLPLFIAALLILSVLIYILYSFEIIQTLGFFVSGLAKLIYRSISLSMWWAFRSLTFVGWLIECKVPYFFEYIYFCFTFVAQLIYNNANLLVRPIKSMVLCISWLVNCSVPYLMEFIPCCCTFIAWIINCSKTFFGWLIDCSLPFIIESISCCLSVFIKLIYFSRPFLDWFIDCLTPLFTSCIFSLTQFSSQEDLSNLQTSGEFL